jgi:ATP-dependent Clp protease ATP-binding subunit ClpB
MSSASERYDAEARRAIIGAEALARDLGHLSIEPLHLLRELLEGSEDLWRALKADRRDLTAFVDVRLARLPRKRGGLTPSASPVLNSVVERALSSARVIGPGELVLAMTQLSTGDDAAELLREFELTPVDVRPVVERLAASSPPRPGPATGTSTGTSTSTSTSTKSWTQAREPQADRAAPRDPDPEQVSADPLTHFGVDLTAAAARGDFDPIVGRGAELRRLMQILTRRTKNNPILIGEPGVGRRTIVRALAMRIVAGDVPAALDGRRIMSVEPGAILAGARMRGELESRIKSIVDSLRQSRGQVVLFAEELPALLGAGAQSGSMGAGEMLKPALARGEVRIIGRTTPQDYRQHIEKDQALARCFQPIIVEEPDEKAAVAVLRSVVERYEVHHGVRIGDPACIAAVAHSKRYVPDRRLPDKAIDLIDEAAARLRIQIDSVPTELDQLERRLEALQIEHASLHDDTDAQSAAHRVELEREMGELVPRARELGQRWRVEKETLDQLRTAKAALAAARREELAARTEGSLSRAAELRVREVPRLEQEVASIEARFTDLRPLVPEAVTPEDIAQLISELTGIPVSKMVEDEAQRLLRMEESLASRVVGQDQAVQLVSRAVRRGRVGLRDPGRPIGSFLFLGPSGVGKTELAKALAEFLFDDEAAITRIDMSEFMERHMVARLVGAPPGYVDSEEGGHLTEAVRSRPYSVVLLDEIEKAHRDVFDLLLQVLDDGRLTDGRGRTVSFNETVIIMTSNIAGPQILDHEGDDDSLRALIDKQLRAHLRPEFVNRIDDIVIFKRLDPRALGGIVRIQTKRLSSILADRGMSLQLTDRAVDLVVEKGYDPAFGARPVRRVIVKQIQDPMAEQILRSGYGPGDAVVVDAQDGRFTFGLAPRA